MKCLTLHNWGQQNLHRILRAFVSVQEKKPRKLSKKEAAKRLRSGTSSALAKKA